MPPYGIGGTVCGGSVLIVEVSQAVANVRAVRVVDEPGRWANMEGREEVVWRGNDHL
jgi:hypothetical protein